MAEYTRHGLPPGGRLSERTFSPSIIHQMIQKVHTQNRKRFPLPQASWLPLRPGSPPGHLSQWEKQGNRLKQKAGKDFSFPASVLGSLWFYRYTRICSFDIFA